MSQHNQTENSDDYDFAGFDIPMAMAPPAITAVAPPAINPFRDFDALMAAIVPAVPGTMFDSASISVILISISIPWAASPGCLTSAQHCGTLRADH